MGSLELRKGDKIHTRNMEISTYDGGDNHIIVEGQLRDDRLVSTYHHISGKKRPPQNVHHMIVRMCIDCASLSIKEVSVEMPGAPNEECGQTAESLNKLEGIRIVPGFTSRVKKLLGGTRGCLHLTTLVLAMAPAIMQGFWAFRSRTQNNGKISTEMVEKYLLNTCWVWRKEGPLAEELFKSLSEESDT